MELGLKLQGEKIIIKPTGPYTTKEKSALMTGDNMGVGAELEVGVVESVGNGCTFVKEGDNVVYFNIGASVFEFNGDKYKFTLESKLVGVVDKPSKLKV